MLYSHILRSIFHAHGSDFYIGNMDLNSTYAVINIPPQKKPWLNQIRLSRDELKSKP